MIPARFSVLFVSTGNICRSPMAERLLRSELSAALGPEARTFHCESAGTWGHDGARMERHAAHVLRELGGNADGFVARELCSDQVLAADLILCASREHREQVRLLDPWAAGRTFSIREFARFALRIDPTALPAAEPAARARALVDRVALLRTSRPGSAFADGAFPDDALPDDDIPDPFGAPLHVFRLCASSIADGLARLVGPLAPAASRGRTGDAAR